MLGWGWSEARTELDLGWVGAGLRWGVVRAVLVGAVVPGYKKAWADFTVQRWRVGGSGVANKRKIQNHQGKPKAGTWNLVNVRLGEMDFSFSASGVGSMSLPLPGLGSHLLTQHARAPTTGPDQHSQHARGTTTGPALTRAFNLTSWHNQRSQHRMHTWHNHRNQFRNTECPGLIVISVTSTI